jgi:signal transduction histidine kinase
LDRSPGPLEPDSGGDALVPVTTDSRVVSNWVDLRGRRGRTRPLASNLTEEVAHLLAVLDQWLQSQGSREAEELRPAFRNLAIAFRDHGFDVKETLAELGDLEDLILGDAPPPGGPPEQDDALPPLSRKLRRAMRVLVAETVNLNHALDRRRNREYSDAVSNFAEILSHELGNRLGAARTGVDLLQDPPQAMDAERRDEVLSLVAAGIDAALTTVDDVGAYMDAQQWGEGDLVPFQDVARRVALGIGPLARRKGVRVEIGESLPKVQIEGARLRLVLSNLLINGIRYADTQKDTCWVQLDARSDGNELRVEVSDNGIGIAPEDQKRVFLYQERGGNSTSNPEGSGLGLTIVREAIHQLGGEVRLESDPGSGSTFQITLPV